jgi:hypothetical protein
MDKKNGVTGIRYSEREKTILKTVRLGFQRVFNIGMQSLLLSLHDPPQAPCIYLNTTGEPCAPRITVPDASPPPASTCRACCPACPIRIAMPKNGRAALEKNGQKENPNCAELAGPAMQ